MSATITSLSLKDVRCFAGEQRAELSRVTLLVGENSAGKSTFLGCLSALGHLSGLVKLKDDVNCFNQAPFSMGSFENLARSGSPSFRVGIRLDGNDLRRFDLEFVADPDGRPLERVLELELGVGPTDARTTLRITREAPAGNDQRWCFDGPDFEFRLDQSDVSYTQYTTWLSRSVCYGTLPFSGEMTQYRKRAGGAVTDRDLVAFGRFINFFRHRFRPPKVPLSIKPIDPRGWERRRYYAFDPLGVDNGGTDLNAINNAGRDLGLFSRIDVRKHAPRRYEVLVDVSGVMRNLADVGYGVTSLIPVIKALVDAPTGSLFLLQQPEVHIHPSAQAKLVEMMAKSPHRFVIETHSDHVIDWFRILVTEAEMAASDIGIVYFERLPDDPPATRLHQLSLDGSGNLSGQPLNYRQFFSEETARLLGLPT